MEFTAKILIVDENEEQRRRCKDILLKTGYRMVEEACDGEDAIIKIDRINPDVVIIDIWLSKLDGIGVIRRVRQSWNENCPMPEFIVVSLVANQHIFLEASNAGAALCMLKPYDANSLCDHIESILESRNKNISSSAVNFEAESQVDIESQITKIIHQIGVPAHIKGYQYLRTAIMMTVRDNDIINSVTKILYPSSHHDS